MFILYKDHALSMSSIIYRIYPMIHYMCCNELILDMCLCESYMHEEYIVIYLWIMHIEILSYGFGLTMIFKWVMFCRIVQVSRVSNRTRMWKTLILLNSRRWRMKRCSKHLEDLKRRIFISLDCIKKPKDLKGYISLIGYSPL